MVATLKAVFKTLCKNYVVRYTMLKASEVGAYHSRSRVFLDFSCWASWPELQRILGSSQKQNTCMTHFLPIPIPTFFLCVRKDADIKVLQKLIPQPPNAKLWSKQAILCATIG